jgi:hypothetical protein
MTTTHAPTSEWDGYPLTITKDELRRALGNPSKFSFREKYLTNQVIERELNMSLAEYRLIHVFTVDQSRALYRFFCLKPEQLNVNAQSR